MKGMRKATKRAGFTLLEATVVAALLSSVLGSVAYMLNSTSNAFRTGSLLAHMDSDANGALQAASRALRGCSADWITPPTPNGSEEAIDFQRVISVEDDGTATPGTIERLAFEYDDFEADDGVDNDGDGLVDEGRLVLTRDVGGNNARTILLRDVCEAPPGEVLGNGLDDDFNGIIDDRGFSITQTNGLLTIRVTLHRLDNTTNQIIFQSYDRTVALRN